MRCSPITESEIIADIRRVARLLQHSPSSLEYMRHGRFDVTTLRRRFKRSWQGIIEFAGLRYTPRTFRRIPSTDELCADLRRVMKEVNHPPTRREYEARGHYGSETIRRRSGQKHWEDAVSSLIGVSREEVKRYQCKGRCYRTTEEWLERLCNSPNDWATRRPRKRRTKRASMLTISACVLVAAGWMSSRLPA